MEKRKLAGKKKQTNPYMVLIGTVILGGFALAASIHQPGDAAAGPGPISDRGRICMLQDTVQGRSGLPFVYNGKTYYLCCAGSLATFRSDAATHSHAIDPIDGKAVDKADAPAYDYRGHAYFFSSAANMAKFAHDPKEYVKNSSSETAEK
jgi:YHS domain-containing protein